MKKRTPSRARVGSVIAVADAQARRNQNKNKFESQRFIKISGRNRNLGLPNNLQLPLLSRNFCQKCVRLNCSNFLTVSTLCGVYKIFVSLGKYFVKLIFTVKLFTKEVVLTEIFQKLMIHIPSLA